jgi:hypothetical protein
MEAADAGDEVIICHHQSIPTKDGAVKGYPEGPWGSA